jgi:Chaperone of endosialidase
MSRLSNSRLYHLGFGIALVMTFSSLNQITAAHAESALQCAGPNKQSVITCCEKAITAKRPVWMLDNHSSCKELVSCGGRLKDKRRCRVVPPDNNPTHEVHEQEQRTQISDIRLKTNIHRIGTTVLNLPLYSFQYRNRAGTFVGVMAQDVLKVEPSAVSLGKNGYYMVDYGKLSIEMERIQ